jgi:squalene cyclase
LSDLDTASRRAAAFLLASHDTDGGWRDFNLYKGVATSWTTAYVAGALASAADVDDRIPEACAAAARFLRRNREPGGGWAYNARCMADADTTALALIFLARLTPAPSLKDVAVLASFQRAGGGFATYKHLPASHPWAAAHAEVTATALRALSLFLTADHAILRTGRAWLTRQAQDRDPTAYWWTTPGYLRLELARLGLTSDKELAATRADAYPFPAALALERSVLLDERRATINGAVEALIGRQSSDGSWPSEPILLVPSPTARVGSPAARDGLAHADQRRIFTTATVLSALTAARHDLAAGGRSTGGRSARPLKRPSAAPL